MPPNDPPPPPPSPDLLGNTRARLLVLFGHPQFAPRLGDEDFTEQFHVGSFMYTIGYRNGAPPADDTKKRVICVLKTRAFGHSATLQPDEIRGALSESRGKPTWNPFRPLPAENNPPLKPHEHNPDPGASTRDFSTDNNDKDTGVLTASGRTGRRRQRVITYTSEWHGIPDRVLDLRMLMLPSDHLEELFEDFQGNAVEYMEEKKGLPAKMEQLLPKE